MGSELRHLSWVFSISFHFPSRVGQPLFVCVRNICEHSIWQFPGRISRHIHICYILYVTDGQPIAANQIDPTFTREEKKTFFHQKVQTKSFILTSATKSAYTTGRTSFHQASIAHTQYDFKGRRESSPRVPSLGKRTYLL